MTDRNRARMRQFDDPENVSRLIDMPAEVLSSLPKSGAVSTPTPSGCSRGSRLRSFSSRRCGLNLAALRLDRHVVQTRLGGVRHIVIAAGEVKNREALTFEISEALGELLDAYLNRARPVLMEDAGGFLFPARQGGAKAPAQLAAQIKRAIFLETEIVLNVHAFRHLAATLFLRKYPGEYETVRLLLGHKSLATTVKAYCGIEQTDALKRHDALIDSHRTKGGKRHVA